MEIKKIRLIDLVQLVPSDVENGMVVCNSGRKIKFNNINELLLQYQLDFVSGFDIKTNKNNERYLVVYLMHN